MRHLTASFSSLARILPATFIAAAFVLLLLLPAFGQATFNRTDGKISSVGLSVGVFADITDAQLEKNRETTYDGETVYLPVDTPPTAPTLDQTDHALRMNDTAYLANGRSAPQHTFFGGTLWASNDPAAYNTILITVESTSIPDPGGDCAVATVRNPRSNDSITVQMPLTAPTGATNGTMKSYYQAFVRVLDERAEDANGDLLYTESAPGPACADYNTTAGVLQDATPFILARHDDRITVEVAGAGAVTLDVDGEGPEVTGITPEDLSYVRSNSLHYSFVVRDNDAGLRHDGESVISTDGDYTEVNRDKDHDTTGEPLSVSSGGQINVNGEAAEIDLKVWATDTDPNAADDITGTGRWTLLGNVPGVAYSFSAGGGGMDEGSYFMEVSASDRAGNRTVSEAPDDEVKGPYLFTVDDTDPATLEAWTGIAYDPDLRMGDKVVGGEFADRSWIMVELTEPVRPGINPQRTRVAGHEVVRVYQPNYAPPFARTVLGRGTNTLPSGTERPTFGPPVPRAAASLAPQAQVCTDTSTDRISGLRFVHSSTTGDTTISWNRLSNADCDGYRLAILSGRTVLLVADLERPTSGTTVSFSIPRASELGRYIEADIGDSDADSLTILVGLRYASTGPNTDKFGYRSTSATVDLASLTAPTAAVTGSVVAPFLLHPASAPAVLPAIAASDASLKCGFTSGDPSWDEVVFSFTHTPLTIGGWELMGYYRQLFYPPDYDVREERLFEYTAVGADGFETSVSFQHYYNSSPEVYNAKGEVVGVYEKDGRRLAGAVRTVGCTGSSITNPNVDRSPPLLQTAAVGGTTLRLTYNETLDGGSTPDGNAFDVRVDGEQRAVDDVSVIGRQVVLTLASPVTAGERVTISYTKPGTNPIQDVAGNDAFSFRLWPVSNVLGGGDNAFDIVDITGLTHEEALAEAGYWPIDINGELIEDTRTRIYIELADELRADETPEVTIFAGGVLDLAGNSIATEAFTPRDGIAPRFTVTVTATAQDRPVANERGEFVVDVRADEDLRRRPVVYFTGIDAAKVTVDGADAYAYDTGVLQSGRTLTVQEDDTHWAGTYPASGLTGLGELFSLVVYGFDYEDNIGESAGWEPPRHQRTPEIGPPDEGDVLDLTEMHEAGVLLEIDEEINGGEAPEHAVTPSRRMRNDETESLNPFISIRFSREADEYAVCPADGCGGSNPDAEFSDSHARVDITAVTLNDRNAMSMLSRVSADRFALVASDLELGSHEIEYMAVDAAGNVDTFEFEFSVVEREPYELNVQPGWNLISFPGTPEDPSLGGVIPSGTRVSPVLAYQDGDWLTAVVNDAGEWGGNLKRFEAGFGYWLFTTTYATLNPVIPEHERTDPPPTTPVRHGWNLLGVMDVFQNPAGTPPGADGGDGEADVYFGSIPWRIAYGYDTVRSLWERSIPGADRAAPEGTSADERGYRLVDGEVVAQEVLNGKGYWVWSAEPGTLAP